MKDKPPNDAGQAPEVHSFNVGDLDVEELDKRLELATAGVDGDCWIMDCGSFSPPPP